MKKKTVWPNVHKVKMNCTFMTKVVNLRITGIYCRILLWYESLPLFAGRRPSFREYPLDRGCGELQKTGENSVWWCPPHNCLHLLPGILHKTLSCPPIRPHLEALSQPAQSMTLFLRTKLANAFSLGVKF